VACAFPAADASALVSIDIRRSSDPTFPSSVSFTTASLGPFAASALLGTTFTAGAFGADDASAPAPGTAPLFYSVRGTTSAGTGLWSPPFAAVDGRAALFAAPGGAAAAASAACGSYSSPCGAIADALSAASSPAQPVLLLPGTFSGAGNRGLSMAGVVRRTLARARGCPCACTLLRCSAL
jgi:hypothetical protein